MHHTVGGGTAEDDRRATYFVAMPRSGTAAAPNYAEARGPESRADFVHKLGIVQKELNETTVWLRIVSRISREKDDQIVAIL